MRVQNTRQTVLDALKKAKEPVTKEDLMRMTGASLEGVKAALWRLRAEGHEIACKKQKGIGHAYTYQGREDRKENPPRDDDFDRIIDYIKTAKKPPTSAQIRNDLCISHPRTQNMLKRAREKRLIENVSKSSEAVWAMRETRVVKTIQHERICAGTQKEPLNMANYWTAPYRPGAQDTMAIKSRGF